jgi:hypothetical protein
MLNRALVAGTDDAGASSRPGGHELSPTFGGVAVAVHDHLCALYRGEHERDRLIADHLREGLRAGETCMYVTTEGERDSVLDIVGFGLTDLDLHLLEVREPSSTYLQGGTFSPDEMLELIDGWSRRTFEREGCSFARAAGDMSWALPHVADTLIGKLYDYESRVTHWTRAYPQTAVCLYDLDRFSGDVLIAMINSHPKTWINGVVIDNPYFSPPS